MGTQEDVEHVINCLKRAYGAETDAELAKALDVGRSTVTAWRSRGSVPMRYRRRIPGEDKSAVSEAPLHWSDEEREAFKLALLRFVRANPSMFASFRGFLDARSSFGDFWLLHQKAKRDIIERMNDDFSATPSDARHALLHHAYNEFEPGE